RRLGEQVSYLARSRSLPGERAAGCRHHTLQAGREICGGQDGGSGERRDELFAGPLQFLLKGSRGGDAPDM
ncbi:hypothetical protein FKM82_022179, partial [Ascaphus truei]